MSCWSNILSVMWWCEWGVQPFTCRQFSGSSVFVSPRLKDETLCASWSCDSKECSWGPVSPSALYILPILHFTSFFTSQCSHVSISTLKSAAVSSWPMELPVGTDRYHSQTFSPCHFLFSSVRRKQHANTLQSNRPSLCIVCVLQVCCVAACCSCCRFAGGSGSRWVMTSSVSCFSLIAGLTIIIIPTWWHTYEWCAPLW